MKRLVTFYVDANGRNRVQSISAPMPTDEISLDLDPTMFGLIDEEYTDPILIDGKKIELYYNAITQMIETEYVDIGYEDLSPQEKIEFLKEENANLKAELELTQMALFELDWMINGGTEEEIPEEELPEENPEEDIPVENIPEEVPPTDVETPVETPEEIPEDEINFDLVAAIEDAEENTVIKLPKDVHLTEEISIKKAITIDLNGHNITSDKGVFIVRSVNGVLSIIGEGLVRGGSGDSYTAITVSTGKAYLEGGEYQVGGDADNLGNATIYASGSGEVYVDGGVYSSDCEWQGKYYVLNKKDKSEAVLVVTGGKFINFNPGDNGSEGTGTNFLAEGYTATEIEENVWEVIPVELVTEDTPSDIEETVETTNNVESNETEANAPEVENMISENESTEE